MKCPFEISWEKITPPLATRWLKEHNTHNRPLRKESVAAFARDMKTRRWAPNHQGIAFAANGTLLDGQHRLSAIVEADVTLWMLVIRGLATETEGVESRVMDTIDRGTVRSLPDLLRLEYGITKEPHVIAATCLQIARLCVEHPTQQVAKATMPQTVGVLKLWGEAIRWMSAARPTTNRLRNVVLTGSLAFAHAARPEETARFFQEIITGAGLCEGAPALTLRNAVLTDAMDLKGNAWSRFRGGVQVLEFVRAAIENREMSKVPRPEDCTALGWFRAQMTTRIGGVAAIFPLTRPVDEKRSALATRKMKAAATPPLTPPPLRVRITPYAEQLLRDKDTSDLLKKRGLKIAR